MASPSKIIIKLLDNSLYCPKSENGDKGRPWYAKDLPDNLVREKGRRGVNDMYDFINQINDRTIDELKSDEGGILVWPHSFKEGKDEPAQMTILNCKFDNNRNILSLSTGNLVGFIGEGKVQIEINSRFSSGEDNGVQDYFLYHMLAKVFHANIVNMEVGAGSLKDLNLLIFMFPRLLKEALIQGMFKQYIKKEYNDCNIRGTIDINRHIRHNYPTNGRIAYRTREFSYDNNITQLVRHTIEYMIRLPMGRALLNGSKETEALVRMIIQSTPTYSKNKRLQVIADNRRPVNHPYYIKYKALQRLCLAILRQEQISHGAQENKVNGLLIDVAWLWEEYVAVVLSENSTGFKHYTNKNAFPLFVNENDKRFQNIIPDYLHEEEKSVRRYIVADAKYIPLHRYEHLDAERAASVYYKTIMYMYRFHTNLGFLFHPCNNNDVTEMEKIQNYKREDNMITCDYRIANDKDCHLHEIGFIVPKSDDKFKENMVAVEKAFARKILQYQI